MNAHDPDIGTRDHQGRPPGHTASDEYLLGSGQALHPALDRPAEDQQHSRFPLDSVVFGVSAALALGFVVWGAFATKNLADVSGKGLDWVIADMGWLFSLVASGFVLFVIWLAMSRYGKIPLGRDGEGPEFRTVSWIAMMFSAGMGIGLMFYGASEPLSHFATPPPWTGAQGNPEALQHAMATTLFHWTLHPWAIYAVVGLALGYSTFRKGRSLLISAPFAPFLGDQVSRSPVGRIIDIFAIFATLFGSATSLGLGALQIGSGMQIVGWTGKVGNGILIAIITALTICFILSAVSGVEKGIQWLSNINMVLALVLALFVFVVGPTVFILDLVPTALGSYFQDLAQMSARTAATGGDATAEWLSGWTIFYWAWWVSWTPFVGMFIARISRGRTVKEFIGGVLLVPSLVSLVWFCIFGGAAIKAEQGGAKLSEAANPETQLFDLLHTMPFSGLMSVIVMVLVAIFFVSGADAASVVMGTLSERGTIEPRTWTVIFWGAATGAVAIIMLLIGGKDALSGLQTITIIAALPFVVIMALMAVALLRDLASDPLVIRGRYADMAIEQAVRHGVRTHGDDFVLSVQNSPQGVAGVGEMVRAEDQLGNDTADLERVTHAQRERAVKAQRRPDGGLENRER